MRKSPQRRVSDLDALTAQQRVHAHQPQRRSLRKPRLNLRSLRLQLGIFWRRRRLRSLLYGVRQPGQHRSIHSLRVADSLCLNRRQVPAYRLSVRAHLAGDLASAVACLFASENLLDFQHRYLPITHETS